MVSIKPVSPYDFYHTICTMAIRRIAVIIKLLTGHFVLDNSLMGSDDQLVQLKIINRNRLSCTP